MEFEEACLDRWMVSLEFGVSVLDTIGDGLEICPLR